MSSVHLVLLGFMALWASGQCGTFISRIRDISNEPDDIDAVKNTLRLEDKKIFQRWLLTEKLTCNEVSKVFQAMKDNIESDLNHFMADARNHLKAPTNDKRKQRCIREIEEDIDDAIKEGVKHFSKCTVTLATIQDQLESEFKEKEEKYNDSIEHTLNNLDVCRVHSNPETAVHRHKCIQEMIGDNCNKITNAYAVFYDSKCMSHFTNRTLTCATQAFDTVSEKSEKIYDDINKCVQYLDRNLDNKNFGRQIMNIQLYYSSYYQQMNDRYDYEIKEFIGLAYMLSTTQGGDLKQVYQNKLNDSFPHIYDALRETLRHYHSEKEKTCTNEALKKINTLVVKGGEEFAECHNKVYQEIVDIVNTMNSTLMELNNKLPEAGNVALLRCIGQRPQQIFRPETISQCAYLSCFDIFLEFKSAMSKMDDLKKLVDKKSYFIYDGLMHPCGPLRFKKLDVDVSRVFNDNLICLHNAAGDKYIVTSPPETSTEYNPDSVTDDEDNYTVTSPPETSTEFNPDSVTDDEDNYTVTSPPETSIEYNPDSVTDDEDNYTVTSPPETSTEDNPDSDKFEKA